MSQRHLLRNLAIIAHIDAGKTTTTERLLYYSGVIPSIGSVDEGSTTTDYLPLERERGISITSAVTTLPWKDHKLNLIDTPGHADFGFEVQRSLRVLDSAIVVLDASKGVEGQTEKVWKHSAHLPKLLYINKMDKEGANYRYSIQDTISKFSIRPAVLQLPLFKDNKFHSILDILNRRILTWSGNGDEIKQKDAIGTELEQANEMRRNLIENLTDSDDKMLDLFTEKEFDISTEEIEKSIRRATISLQCLPIYCGASARNVGVQPILDGVVKYLPSPQEVSPPVIYTNGLASSLASTKVAFCGLAFKVIWDGRGFLTFVRVYKGQIERGMSIVNSTNKTKEKAVKVLVMSADEAIDVAAVSEGNIAVVVGLKSVSTGDTLVSADTRQTLSLFPIDLPPPLFVASLETPSVIASKKLEDQLPLLVKEDPSLSSLKDSTGQLTLSGLGELHLEIAKDRLINHFGAEVEFRELRIEYTETISADCGITGGFYEKIVDGKISSASVDVELKVANSRDIGNLDLISLGNHNSLEFDKQLYTVNEELSSETISALRNGAEGGLMRGPALFLPMRNVRVRVVRLESNEASPLVISNAIRNAIFKALKDNIAYVKLMEPVMRVTIGIDESVVGVLLKELNGKGGSIIDIREDGDIDESTSSSIYNIPSCVPGMSHNEQIRMRKPRTVVAKIPLKETLGFAQILGSITGGKGTFSMLVDDFEPMSDQRANEAKRDIRGY